MEVFHFGHRDREALERAEQHSAEIETKIANAESKIDPLREMVHQMRTLDFWGR